MHTLHSFVPGVSPIADLRPTQITIGMREVSIKRRKWRDRSTKESAAFLESIKVPVVLGPNRLPYAVDRHHLLRALHDEGVRDVPIAMLENRSGLPQDQFWTWLEQRGWAHPIDQEGRRRAASDMPTSISELLEDPYRSLAGALKRAGAYAKDKMPFSEFRWADFLRSRIDRNLLDHDFNRALAIAMEIAATEEACHLPGWRGANALPMHPATAQITRRYCSHL